MWLVSACLLLGCPRGAARPAAPAGDICPPSVCPAVRDTPAGTRQGVQPYAITISGGVSLGSYEAGLNWAVLELLRSSPDHTAVLEGVTGASAGSINSLFTAISWCQEQSPDAQVDVNLFSNAWRNIGFDNLLPETPADYALADDQNAYGPDLVMSRKKAFDRVLRETEALLGSARQFRTCDIRLGMTVTSRDAKTLEVSGLHVGNQRYVIPLRVRSDGSRLEFSVDSEIHNNTRKDLLGNLLFLAPDEVVNAAGGAERRFVVHPRSVIRAALASSAFPGAFGPIALSHCVEKPRDPTKTDEQIDKEICNGGAVVATAGCRSLGRALEMKGMAVQCTQKFIDGGVFDNVPLGVAMAQLESQLSPSPNEAEAPRPLRYIYMYYNNRRRVPARGPPRPTRENPSGPLGDTLSAVGGIVDTAQQYELHNVLRYNRWNAGTSKQACAVANLLDGRPAEVTESCKGKPRVSQARALADQVLESARRFGPADRSAMVGDLRDVAWTLDALSLSGSDFLYSQKRVLTALDLLCRQKAVPLSGCPQSAIADLTADVRNNRELILTRRFSPLTGMHVAHFGAFFDRPFRDYDYYAGVYDGLINEAERQCLVPSRPPDTAQQAVASENRDECVYRQFVAARRRLRIESGSAFEVTQALWAVEHGAALTRYPEGPIGRVMQALLDPQRCDAKEGETLTANRYCVHDLGLEAFLGALERADYRPDSAFLVWAKSNPSRWWMLPAAYGAERVAELARREERGTLGFVASLAASYVENGVDQGSETAVVAPSSLPRRFGLFPRSLFPFFAFSMHPTRRFELGLLRGGVRPAGLPFFRHFDFLADASLRVTVAEPDPPQEDNGYGLFTRGAIVPHVSGSVVWRIQNPILWSLGARSGVPVTFFNVGPESFTYDEQINAELDVVLLADKLRFAIGCHPLTPPPSDDCWRDLYYSFGVNDLAGLAYWTGLNPFHIDRLAVPFVAPRVPFRPGLWDDGWAIETGLLRAGYRLWWFGLWGDTSIVASEDTTWNGSVALELSVERDWFRAILRSVGLRWGFPLSIREDARIEDNNLELVFTTPINLRLAAGVFPARDEGEERPLEHPYVSIGFDPGSIALFLLEKTGLVSER